MCSTGYLLIYMCLEHMFRGPPAWARNVKRSRFGRGSATSRSVTRTVSQSHVNESAGGGWSEFTDDTPYGM